MKTIISLLATLLITSCGGITDNNKKMNTLPDVLQVGQSILSRDSIEQVDYPTLTAEQCSDLARQTSLDVPDDIQLIGTRAVDKGITLAAYKIPIGENPNLFKVYLVTHDNKGAVIDALDLREFHTSANKGPLRFGGNRFYTTDSELTFDGNRRIVLHRKMTLTSLYLKDHTLTELWRVEWDNRYEISDGHFVFKGQQETFRTADVDDPVIEEYKSRDIPK